MTYQARRAAALMAALSCVALLTVTGCGGMAEDESPGAPQNGWGYDGDGDGDAGDGDNWGGEPPPPEDPEEYEFSQPAIVGDHVYVANETLNSVAVIDSRNLSVRTILAGSRPVEVVGPGAEGAADADARVMALNLGSSTVTIIDPSDFTARHLPVLPRSNRIAMAPGARHAVVWYDSGRAEPGEQAGDLSAVSVVSAQGSFQIAVGFHVRDVRFDESGAQALVITDDGISVLKLTAIDADAFSPPRKIVPASKSQHPVRALTIETTSDGRYAIAHRHGHSFVIFSDLDTQETFAVELPTTPTGVALRETEDTVEVIAMLREEGAMLRATVPDGLRAAYEGAALAGILLNGDNGDNGDNGEDPEPEPEPEPDLWTEYEGFRYVMLPFTGPGSLHLSADAETAFLFTTLNNETRGVLFDLESEAARIVHFEKGIRGALGDGRGDTFLVFHSRKEGSTAGLSPADPEYIARSHGFSVVDVRSGESRIFLTELEPAEAALWSPETGDARIFLTFAPPQSTFQTKPGHNDVVRINLTTLRKDSFRLASLPDGLGLIPAARKVYINQRHPQGRMTFVDVETNDRQTVTGYQLNAGIE